MRTRDLAVAVVLAAPVPLGAQATADARSAMTCVRLSFGPWSPPLNWNAAGHADSVARVAAVMRLTRDSVFAGQASVDGRDEMQWYESHGVRRLLLSPAWWPAGVVITFTGAAGDSTAGDTLTGHAVALVADASQPAPRAIARVLRSGCPPRAP